MKKMLSAGLVLVGLSGFAGLGWAQGHAHEDHFLTFETAVALPNGVVLPAGTYLFKLPNRQHQLTQILSQDRTQVFATLQTVATRRTTAKGSEVVLERTGADTIPRLRAWYCWGNPTGHQFLPIKR